MSKNIQFNLRIPADLKDRIASSAKATGRSVNGEAQHRLEKSFSNDSGSYKDAMEELTNFFENYVRSERLTTIAEKLNFLMNEAKAVSGYGIPIPSISRLALAFGYDSVGEIENWFKGYSEPSFDNLKQLAKYYGAQENWLIHDEGKPFKKESFEFEYDIDGNAKRLLSGLDDNYVKSIWFVRNQSNDGELIIVKIYENWHGLILQTRVHVSNNVGLSGSRDRALMSLTLKKLCKDNIRKTRGAIVSEKDYSRLFWAEENPVKIIQEFTHSTWIEDIWDSSMYCRQELSYWEGWSEMCESNNLYIKHNETLSNINLKN